MERREFMTVGLLVGAEAILGLGVGWGLGGGINFLRRHWGASSSQISESGINLEVKGETYPNQIYAHGRPIFMDLLGISPLEEIVDDSRTKLIPDRESEKNIADNLVTVAGINELTETPAGEVFEMKGSGGTGLQLTTDGFVLTAYHNIRGYEEDWRRINKENPLKKTNVASWMEDMKRKYVVVDQQRKAYPIDTTFWATNPAFDIALIKAVTEKRAGAIKFKTMEQDLKVGDEIKLLGLRDQRMYNQYGRVISSDVEWIADGKEKPDTFLTDAYGVPGFSGGVFVSTKGEFAGLSLYIQRNGTVEIGHAGGAKVRNIVNLLKESARELNKLYQ